MSNVLDDEKQHQVIALGRLGWSLRRIEGATGVRRETASGYLKEAGVEIRPPGGWGRPPAAQPANGLIIDSVPRKPATEVFPDSAAEHHDQGGEESAKPAIQVTTDSARSDE